MNSEKERVVDETTTLDPQNSIKPRKLPKRSKLPEDPIAVAIGNYGDWQLIITFLLSLFNIPCTWNIYVPTFCAESRDFWCSAPPHLADVKPQVWRKYSQPDGPCTILNLDWSNVTKEMVEAGNLYHAVLTECKAWTWDGKGSTIKSEWALVCDRAELSHVAEMVFLIGIALGGLLSGTLSDRYGRKWTLLVYALLQTIVGIMIAFAPWFSMYLVLRTLLGFIFIGVCLPAFVLSLEVVGGIWRTIVGITYLFPVSLGYISITGLAWLLRDWRDLQLAISLPSIALLLIGIVLPESPRWLLEVGRNAEVLEILHQAAYWNGKTIPPETEKLLSTPSSKPKEKNRAGIFDLFRTKNMRNNTFCLLVIWFSLFFIYYGIVLNLGKIGGNLYVNSVLFALVEIPAIAMSIIVLVTSGRRWPLCVTLVFAGLACLATLFVPGQNIEHKKQNWLITTCAVLGKFSVTSSNAMIPLFTAELYPTVIRNIGIGVTNISAGVALIMVPYLWNLSILDARVPLGVLGLFGVVGGLCVLYLPETGNKPLVGTLPPKKIRKSTTNGKKDSVKT